MRCDACNAPVGWELQVRRHPENPAPHTNWHIHYCLSCAYVHDYRELARIMNRIPLDDQEVAI